MGRRAWRGVGGRSGVREGCVDGAYREVDGRSGVREGCVEGAWGMRCKGWLRGGSSVKL